MALYYYQAFSKDGKKVSGYIDAATQQAARENITRQGLFPIKVEAATAQAQAGIVERIFGVRVNIKDKIFFTKQLSVLLKSGIPLLQALELLVEQTEGSLKSIVIVLKDDIKEGRSLADALDRYPKVFDNIYIQLVRAGEATGRLEIILERLVVFLERQQAIRKKVVGALRYPLIQLGIVAAIVVILLTAVVPQIASTFEEQGAKLPGSTRFLMASSNFLKNHYLLLVAIIASIVGLFMYWKSTPSGRRIFDTIVLKLPVVKYFSRTKAIVQFSRTFGMLVESGVNLPGALSIVVNIVDNRILSDALKEARENIIKQGKIAQFLKQTNIFPPIAIYLINTGEQSGNLDKMLIAVAEYYETELTEYADTLTAIIDPIMLVVMAVVVGFVVMAIITPIQEATKLTEVK